ncbi:hypothetical protein [Bosea thiooxidans]
MVGGAGDDILRGNADDDVLIYSTPPAGAAG